MTLTALCSISIRSLIALHAVRGLAALLLIAVCGGRASAQIAGCTGSIPAGMSVVDELRHDDGSPAQFVVGAAGPGGSQREIHHGNRFVGNGQLITHVCVYAEVAGERIDIYFSSGDDTTFGDVRPYPPLSTYSDTIQGGYQLIDINPPVVASGVFWIVAAFPDATPNNGHVGVTDATSPGVFGEAFVGIMPGAPGGLAIWSDYENVPGASPYPGMRPLIRGLHLDASPGCNGAGVIVNTLGNLTTSEQGGTTQVSVVLDGPTPTHNVLAILSSSDTTEGTLNPSVLIFTPANYTVPQSVTVTGQDDLLLDGDVSYTISFLLSSLDSCYHALAGPDVPVVNFDDDIVQPNGVCCMGTVCDPTLQLADCAANGGVWQLLSPACMFCCPTDTNGDGTTDVDDLVSVILDWGTDGTLNGGDVDGSGHVDVDDLVAVILAWGPC